MKLKGKTALITGASSGMGKAIAVLYGKEGANVIVADINEAGIESVVNQITENGGQATGLVADVSKKADSEKMVDTAVKTYGTLDILVNNAGIMDNFVPVGDLTDELWNRIIAINLTGPFMAARAALKVMVDQKDGGVIINNASVGGLFGSRGGAAYTTSKHGLVGMTKNIASTYGLDGKIRCNAIAPGGVNTNIAATITNPNPLGLKAMATVGEAPMGEPEQIAKLALFLASDDSDFINGDIIKIDGGWTAR